LSTQKGGRRFRDGQVKRLALPTQQICQDRKDPDLPGCHVTEPARSVTPE